MKLVIILILFVFISMMYVGQMLYENDVKDNTLRDITNMTNQIQWNETLLNGSFNVFNNSHVSKIIHSGINFIGTTLMETSKWGVNYGYNNTKTYDFKFLFNLLKWVLYIIIIAAIFPIVVPLLALFYLGYVGIKLLINKIIKLIKQ